MQKKIFISYSWTTPKHEDWVLELAQKLTHDGVQVILDKWDLKPGQDKYSFMEQMVHADDINKVLIILDKKYTEKANDRSGGVGTETMIISAKVYESTIQEKFIPIVVERDEEGQEFLPTYLGSRIYIDLSEESSFEENYEQLLRQIYERPSLARPKLGSPPKYLFSDSPQSYKTSSILRSFDSQIDRHPQRINTISREYFDALYIDLLSLPMNDKYSNWIEFGKNLNDNISRMKVLRDDYIQFISKIISEESGFDVDIIISFLEEITSLLGPPENVSNGDSNNFSNYKYMIHEFWLYTVAIGIKKQNYKFLETILFSSFFSKKRYSPNSAQRYDLFYQYIDHEIKHYIKESTGREYISAHAHLLMSNIPEQIKKTDIINADLLCYYVGLISNVKWFPITYIYQEDLSKNFSLLSKLISKRHIEKVMKVFGTKDVNSLKAELLKIDEKRERGYFNAFGQIPNIGQFVKIEEIGTYS